MTDSSDSLFADTFFPYATRRMRKAQSEGKRFAYYTTADTAVRLLRSRELWLRNASVMNDFKETIYGHECLVAAYRSEHGQRLKTLLAQTFPGADEELERSLDDWAPLMRAESYMICVSEHRSEEDRVGRLSMWRAYGGSTGVALVFKGAPMFRPSDALAAYSNPVFYADETEFTEEFGRLIDGLVGKRGYLVSLGRSKVIEALFNVFRTAILCTKHPGFGEEREWRVVSTPSLHSSTRTRQEVEIIRGVPQRVLKIPLSDVPEEGLYGIELPALLDSVIIGPCEFPWATQTAFMDVLTELDIADPLSRIRVSDIPLRHS